MTGRLPGSSPGHPRLAVASPGNAGRGTAWSGRARLHRGFGRASGTHLGSSPRRPRWVGYGRPGHGLARHRTARRGMAKKRCPDGRYQGFDSPDGYARQVWAVQARASYGSAGRGFTRELGWVTGRHSGSSPEHPRKTGRGDAGPVAARPVLAGHGKAWDLAGRLAATRGSRPRRPLRKFRSTAFPDDRIYIECCSLVQVRHLDGPTHTN